MKLLEYDKVVYETNRIVSRIKNQFGIPIGYDLSESNDYADQSWLRVKTSSDCELAIKNIITRGTPLPNK